MPRVGLRQLDRDTLSTGGSRRRMRFTFNTMVLLPLLRSLPAATVLAVLMVLCATLGLDFGLLRLGRVDTAADELVALMMAFSVSVPALWAVYMVTNAWTWAIRAIRAHRSSRSLSDQRSVRNVIE